MFNQLYASILWFFNFLLIIWKTLPRDFTGLCKLIKHHVLIKYNTIRKRDFIYVFRKNVERYKSKPCFILDDKTLSFQQVCIKYKIEYNKKIHFSNFQVEDLTNQLANFFSAEGYSRGDVIALVLENSLEYPCVWIGLSKIGCITALINTNLRAKPLLHSIKTVNAKAVITSKQILSGKKNFFF